MSPKLIPPEAILFFPWVFGVLGGSVVVFVVLVAFF